MKLFVYGTLRKNHNNNLLLTTSTYLGEAVSENGYTLAVSGIPYLIKGDDNVIGELYEVNEDDLQFIDMLEGHPHAYTRQDIKVFFNGELITVQAYHWLHNDKKSLPTYNDYARFTGRY